MGSNDMIATVPLIELCEKIVDCPHSTPLWTESGEIVLRSQNIRNGRLDLSSPSLTDEEHFKQRIKRAVPRAGDLVITREAPMGEVCEIPEGLRCCLGQRMVLLRPLAEECSGRYLLYALQSPRVQDEILMSEGTGSTVSNLRIPVLEQLPIPYHPLPEQRAIAEILGSLDDKIELNRRMNRALEGMARAIFKAWFIDFEPVKAKAAGATHFPGMPQETFDQLPTKLVESDLGPIPEGWEVGTLEDVVEIHDSKRIPLSKKQREKRRGDYPYYGATGIIDYVDDYLFDGVHVLLGEDGSVVRDDGTPFVQYVWGRYWVNNHAHVLSGRGSMSNEQLFLFLQQVNIRPYVTGAVQLKINQANMKAVSIVMAPDTICQSFASFIEPSFNMITANERESRVLAALRDTLLPKLISGEVRVGEAKQILERKDAMTQGRKGENQ